jgi:hypothetical protein
MDALELFAALAVFGGLAAVMAEIWLKDAAIFGEIVSDLRVFADPSRELADRQAAVGRKAEPALTINDGGLMQAA